MPRPHVRAIRRALLPTLALALVAGAATPAVAQDQFGAADTTFAANVGTGANSQVTDIAVQPDKKIVLIGSFTEWNGAPAPRIVRLNADGTRDTTFDVGTGPAGGNPFMRSVGIQPDGKIVVTGNFADFNGAVAARGTGTTIGGIVRLNADGSVDIPFATTTGSGFAYTPSGIQPSPTISVQPDDGKIVVIGQIDEFNGDFTRTTMRLNADGTPDEPFNGNVSFPGFNQYPSWVQALAGGKVMQGGYIAGWGGDANAGSFQLLNADGTLDSAWRLASGAANNQSYAGARQSDGKWILSGNFTTLGDQAIAGRIVRLNADGAIDTAWTSEVSKAGNGFPFSIAMMPDDTAILTGVFAKIAGVDAPGITAVKKDGTIDSGFVSSVGTGPGPFPGDADYARSRTRTEYEGGALYAYGDFTEWNAKSAGRIVRLANRPAGTGGGSSSSGGNGGRAGLLATPIAPLRRGNGGQVVTARLVFPEAGRYTLMLGSGKVATAQEFTTAQGFTSSARVTFRKGSRLGARILTRASSAPVISTKAANAVVNIRALVRKGKMGASPTLRIVRKNSDGTYASQVIRG